MSKTWLLATSALVSVVLPAAAQTAATTQGNCTTATTQLAASLIPPGYLHTVGNQIVDAANELVRIASVGSLNWAPYTDQDMQKIILAGFNAFRISYVNATMQHDLGIIDELVAMATKYGMKVIIDHHDDEGDGDCMSQQKNGLWYDSGPGTNGTDGCGAQGTVTQAKFLQDWITVAKRYAGNSTVIGFDLDNEPLEIPGGSTWGDGNPLTDIRLMYQNTGNAILAVDPGVLIFAEGLISFSGAVVGDFDLTGVQAAPVALSTPGHVVYSVHVYPKTIGGQPVDSGPGVITQWNTDWGYLVTSNIAPIWVGEIGASLDKAADSSGSGMADEQAWAATATAYLTGQDGAQGGPTFTGSQQAISTDWWAWGNFDNGGAPDGTLDSNQNVRQGQFAVYSKFQQLPICGQAYVEPAGLAPPSADTIQAAVTQAEQDATSSVPHQGAPATQQQSEAPAGQSLSTVEPAAPVESIPLASAPTSANDTPAATSFGGYNGQETSAGAWVFTPTQTDTQAVSDANQTVSTSTSQSSTGETSSARRHHHHRLAGSGN